MNSDSQSNDGKKKRKYTTQTTQVERAIDSQIETNDNLKICIGQNAQIIDLLKNQLQSQNKTNELLQMLLNQNLNNPEYDYVE